MLDIFVTLIKVIPIVLCLVWCCGALLYHLRYERKYDLKPSPRKNAPLVSVVVPCHNEERTIASTVSSIDRTNYPCYELIAVNDGSSDRTSEIVRRLSITRRSMRTVDLKQNLGKAAALNFGLMASRGKYIVCVDADTELHPDAIEWMVRALENNPDWGAVTGNPRVKNRNTLVGRLQVGEFSAMIGMIKRYQQILGKLFTVAGVIVAYRKEAILDVGLWDTESVTEDIAISWRLQTQGWNLGYEPRALCDVLMPGTLKGLWRQRYRWAQGGFEVMSKHCGLLLQPGQSRLKMIYAEYIFSVLWAALFLVSLVWTITVSYFGLGQDEALWFRPAHWGFFLVGALGLAQFVTGTLIQRKFEKPTFYLFFWSIWYPFAYWMINSAVLIVAIPRTMVQRKRRFSTWVSPDRGGV